MHPARPAPSPATRAEGVRHSSSHPDFEEEQRAISDIYRARDAAVDRSTAAADSAGANLKVGQALARHQARMDGLAAADQLVIGRLATDRYDVRLGVRKVSDPQNSKVLVASWATPAAAPFFEATRTDPGQVRLLRRITEQGGVLRQLRDEIGGTATPAVPRPRPDGRPAPAEGLPRAQVPRPGPRPGPAAGSAPAPQPAAPGGSTGQTDEPAHPEAAEQAPEVLFSDDLLNELDRARDGVMHQVVATIQRDQYRIITAPHDRPLVVQGGPGTGKTVVGLHRAALLAERHPDIRAGDILVLAPTRALVHYIEMVLPVLGIQHVVHLDLAGLYVGDAVVSGADTPQAARVKGSAEMASVLRRALRERTGWAGGDLFLKFGSVTLRIPEQEIQETLFIARQSTQPHNRVRTLVRERLTASALASAERQGRPGRANVIEAASIRRLNAFTNALDRMWPSFTPEAFLRSLFSTQAWLTGASEGVLPTDARAALFRPAAPTMADERWTPEDRFLLDELSALLDGTDRTFTHVVVDEAQDLSPMQARAIARRCPSRSLTLLGDLAQASGPWIRDSWDELGLHLGAESIQVETLSVSYRVPQPALALAARQLPLISPHLSGPDSARPGAQVEWVRAHGEGARRAVEHARGLTRDARTVAIIALPQQVDEVLVQAARAGVEVGDGTDGNLEQSVTVLPVTSIRGLEFDHVVVLDPAALVLASPYGRRDLYVALTRCTQQLHIVHDELPTGIALPAGPAPDAAAPAQARGWQELFTTLSSRDQQLVEELVRRLARG